MKQNNKDRRSALKAVATVSLLSGSLPSDWKTPIVNAVLLPAHAQTSFDTNCSGIETEPVDEPINITVTATEIRGPIVITRNGNSFVGTATNDVGQCSDSSERSEVVELSGTIDSSNNRINGVFNVRQFCGSTLACEQLTTFSADQTAPVLGDDLGDYQGRVTGTLRCCVDFL